MSVKTLRHIYQRPLITSLSVRNGLQPRRKMSQLRIGFVPEHFSTPLHFAQKHYELDAELIPFPTGTGALSAALKQADRSQGIDVAIGLTEGFVADLGKAKSAGARKAKYGLVGTYVESPLCWAISTGAKRSEIQSVGDLKDRRVGVSRIGSGSYVMSFVLADQHGWLQTQKEHGGFEDILPIGDFAALRRSVNLAGAGNEKDSDFFMWEHFTTKHFWDNGELKRVGEIYTPWPSWMIAARKEDDTRQEMVDTLLGKLNQGVKHYHEQREEALDHITSTMHYSREDAMAWMDTVTFAQDVRGVKSSVVDNVVSILRKSGVLDETAGGSEYIITQCN